MTDDSLDKLFREKAREQENVPPPQWPSTDTLWNRWIDKRERHKRRIIFWHRVAASIMILALAGYALLNHNKSNNAFQNISSDTAPTPSEQHAMDFINTYCASKHISCNTPDMLELRQDLEESFGKLEEIDQQLQVYGDSPELIRARSRIESHQARLIKTIVQTL